jgi:hypothetical protein
VWDYDSLHRSADQSDQFATTWAGDNHLYTAWGDGWGFAENGDKRHLGVSRIEGMADDYEAFDLWSGIGKSNAILSVGGRLYMVITEQGQWMRGRMTWSDDYGEHWTLAPDWTFAEPGGAFAAPALLQFGRDYQGARDAYVYGYSEKTRGVILPHIVLFRVPKERLADRSTYEFFAGLDGSGKPRWTADVNGMKPVFSDPKGVGWGVQAIYHPVFRRYLLTVIRDYQGSWGIFDAPEPWGPWTTVAYYTHWLDTVNKHMYVLNQKWMSADGKTFWMIFSGRQDYDAFNVIRGTFVKKR